MKTKSHAAPALALLLALAGSAHASLYIPSGTNTGVTAHFEFTVDPVASQLLLQIDNSYAGPGGVTGTITSFGFTVPDSLVSSATLISQSWDVLAVGHVEPADWTLVAPYDLSAGGNLYAQDVGLLTGPNPNGGNPPKGIWFGEKVSFVFQFDAFASATGFLGDNGVTARWQEVTAQPGSDEGFGSEVPPFTAAPEPSTYGIMGAGVLGLGALIRRRRLKVVTAPIV